MSTPATSVPQAREALNPQPSPAAPAGELVIDGDDDQIELLPDEELPPLPEGDTGTRDEIVLDTAEVEGVEMLEEAGVVAQPAGPDVDMAETQPADLFETPGTDLSKGNEDDEGRA